MYIDLIILIVIILVVVIYCRNFSAFVFITAIVDILLRILAFIRSHIGLPDFKAFLEKYFPDSIFSIIDKYTNGDISIILKWLFVIIMIFFLYYVIRIFIKKKKF